MSTGPRALLSLLLAFGTGLPSHRVIVWTNPHDGCKAPGAKWAIQNAGWHFPFFVAYPDLSLSHERGTTANMRC